jgi:quercetin dioxygenase-like cupin family protein
MEAKMGKRVAAPGASCMTSCLIIAFLISSGAVAQDKRSVQYKVISTQDFIKSVNPKPGDRVRVEILNEKADQARNLNGILSSIPAATPGAKPAYHYHKNRESVIQILSGDATEMVEGKPVPLKPGDVIYIAPNIKHTMMNNSVTQEVKYMEFFSPIAPDTVQVGE